MRAAGKGLFVKEIERALLARKIDLAVHSLKDVPSELPEGLVLGAYLEREEAADAYIGRTSTPIEQLGLHAVIGTSSLRRQAILRAVFKHLDFEDLKGNLDTRIEKLNSPRSKMAGIIVAAAGLRRLLGESAPAHQLLAKSILVPAPGQGTLALECRGADEDTLDLVALVDHESTRVASLAERAVLRRLDGGCQVPLGVFAVVGDDGLVKVTACIANVDGTRLIRESATASAADAEGVALALETLLRNKGADEILASLHPRRASERPSRNGHKRPAPRRKSSRRKAKARR